MRYHARMNSRTLVPALALLSLSGLLTPAWGRASMTVEQVARTPTYGVYHDQPTDFVFVRLPSGWKFVAKDEGARKHRVFHDGPTGFVFVKLSSGWKFVPATN